MANVPWTSTTGFGCCAGGWQVGESMTVGGGESATGGDGAPVGGGEAGASVTGGDGAGAFVTGGGLTAAWRRSPRQDPTVKPAAAMTTSRTGRSRRGTMG